MTINESTHSESHPTRTPQGLHGLLHNLHADAPKKTAAHPLCRVIPLSLFGVWQNDRTGLSLHSPRPPELELEQLEASAPGHEAAKPGEFGVADRVALEVQDRTRVFCGLYIR